MYTTEKETLIKIEGWTVDWVLMKFTHYYGTIQALEKPTKLIRLFKWYLGCVDEQKSDAEEQRIVILEKADKKLMEFIWRKEYSIIPFEIADFNWQRSKRTKKYYSNQLLMGNGEVKPNYVQLIINGHFKKKEDNKKC